MSTEWTAPVSTPTELFIAFAQDEKSFGDIFNECILHFGSDVPLDQLRISYVQWEHQRDCHCCIGASVQYGDYYRIELVSDKCEETPPCTLAQLTT